MGKIRKAITGKRVSSKAAADNAGNQEFDPGSLLRLSGQYWQTCTLHAGVKLDIFSIIGEKILSAEMIADNLKTDNRATEMLLNALTAMKLLARKDGSYINTEPSLLYLCRNAKSYLGHMILHHHHLMASWSRLDEAIREGKSLRTDGATARDEWREAFLMGMNTIAGMVAPLLVRAVDLSGRRRLLDLGGGPGTHAIHFCLAYPNLGATIIDLPSTRPFAEKTIKEAGLGDRITFMAGSYLDDDNNNKGNYDAVLLSQILHGESDKDCRRIIRRAVAALEAGGIIIIHDFILNDTLDGPLQPAIFSLNMLLGTPSGQSYSERQIREMLSDANVSGIQRLSFRGPNDSGVIIGLV